MICACALDFSIYSLFGRNFLCSFSTVSICDFDLEERTDLAIEERVGRAKKDGRERRMERVEIP